MKMVVIAQLAEHRIVVPSVVGSSPTLHPQKRHQTCNEPQKLNKKLLGFVICIRNIQLKSGY